MQALFDRVAAGWSAGGRKAAARWRSPIRTSFAWAVALCGGCRPRAARNIDVAPLGMAITAWNGVGGCAAWARSSLSRTTASALARLGDQRRGVDAGRLLKDERRLFRSHVATGRGDAGLVRGTQGGAADLVAALGQVTEQQAHRGPEHRLDAQIGHPEAHRTAPGSCREPPGRRAGPGLPPTRRRHKARRRRSPRSRAHASDRAHGPQDRGDHRADRDDDHGQVEAGARSDRVGIADGGRIGRILEIGATTMAMKAASARSAARPRGLTPVKPSQRKGIDQGKNAAERSTVDHRGGSRDPRCSAPDGADELFLLAAGLARIHARHCGHAVVGIGAGCRRRCGFRLGHLLFEADARSTCGSPKI